MAAGIVLSIEDIRAVRPIAMEAAVRTPLVALRGTDIHLKLENLQPIGSFKIRGAHAQIEALRPAATLTASAGNMAQAVAFCSRRLGIACTVVVPDHAPRAKTDAVERLGGRVIRVPFERWWRTFEDRAFPGVDAAFIHPFAHPKMLAGNGTIGLEILEDLPDVETVLVPWGGGGLACGIAVALRALKPDVKIYACEVDVAAPLSASWRAGSPRTIEYRKSFVDGIGAKAVFPEMFEAARGLLDGVATASVDEIRAAVRDIVLQMRVVPEGAGAVAPAVARRLSGRIACIVSGGSIDGAVLAEILS